MIHRSILPVSPAVLRLRRNRALAIAPFLLLFAALACVVPGLNSTPTPYPSPTPQGDTIYFSAPYRAALTAGASLPGTNIQYVQPLTDRYELSIDGLPTYRQLGDSLTWQGMVAPGVFGRFGLRIESSFGGQLFAEGNANIAVLYPAPIEIPPSQAPAGAVQFSGIDVQYVVPVDHRIPGTSLVYEGQQNQVAELSGTVGYPYFSEGDSLFWLGKLRNNVYVRYNLNLLDLDAERVVLGGQADLWVDD